MCLELLADRENMDHATMTKSIKISDTAHKALEFAKAYEGIQIGRYASIAIMESIQRDHPDVYKKMKEYITAEESN